jgi:hypothetical protein
MGLCDTRNSERGSHSAALTGNIPIWHISTLFRPQYWAFFVLPPGYAFAFYWQCKALALVLGVFAWLLLLTRSTFWSVTGSLWYFFSPLTQWAYSWPSALPEMTGFLLLAVVLACCLTVEKRKLALFVESLGLAVCAIEFALCSYPPHMIPLFWVATFSFVAWCVAKRGAIFQRNRAAERLLAFACAAAIVAAVGLLVFIDLRVALAGIANTIYPGRRILNGGTTPWFVLLSSFLAWTETESRIPAALGNICEGSSYLWLAPVTLILLGRLKLGSVQKWGLAALWLSFCILLIWLVFPVPAMFGAVLGLDRTGGARLFPALGLANVAIVMLCGAALSANRPLAAAPRGRESPKRKQWLRAGAALLAFASILLLLRAVNRDFQHFFQPREIFFAAVMATGLVYLFLTRLSWAFAALLIPIERGLPVYLDSGLRRFIQRNPVLLTGKWIMFSDAVVNSGFLAATGAEVYTGTHYLPDIDHFPVYGANGLDLNILNRDGYLDAHLRRPGDPMKVEMPVPVVVQWDVRPGDPILKQLGIQYAAMRKLSFSCGRFRVNRWMAIGSMRFANTPVLRAS